MAIESQDDTEPQERRWVPNPKGIYEGYSNYIHASWSLFDTRILFGHLKPTLGSLSDFVVEEQAAMSMSWAQTKNLVVLLSGMIEAYESVNGEIAKINLAPVHKDIGK